MGDSAELFKACLNSDLDALNTYLKTNGQSKVNSKDEDGRTPLMVAVEQHFTAGVQRLLANGASQLTVDSKGVAPVHIAILKGYTDLVELLIPKAKYLDVKRNGSCLHFAIASGSKQMFDLVMSKIGYVNYPESHREPLIIFAARYNNLVEEVLAAPEIPTKVDQINYLGWGAIHFVTKHKNLNFLKALIAAKANLNLYNLEGETALHIASTSGWLEGVVMLEQSGASLTCRNRDGNTPLHLAVYGGHTSVDEYISSLPSYEFLKTIDNKDGKCIGKANKPARAPIKLQLISDVHVEFHGTHDIFLAAPYLILAGDIGKVVEKDYEDFILSMADKYQKVFVVGGNHEFYSGKVEQVMLKMKQICDKHPNLFLLNRTRYMLDEKTRLIGTIMWSNIPAKFQDIVGQNLNDYYKISTSHSSVVDYATTFEGAGSSSRAITPKDTNFWHQQDVKWIQSEIADAKEKGEQVVIVTHHAPVMDCSNSDGEYEVEIHYAFSTPLNHLLGHPVSHWLFGHTHWFYDVIVGGTRVVNNPEGYPSEKIPYDGGFIVNV